MSGNQADQLRRALEQRRQQLSNSFGQGNRQSGAGGQKQARSGQTRRGKGQGGEDGTEAGGTGLDPNAKGHASRQVDPSTGKGEGADTPLVFGDDAEMDPNRLKFEALPKGSGGEAEELYGLKAANPRTGRQPLSGGTSNGAAAGDQAPGNGEAPMLPKNRALIQKYFDTNEHAGGGGQ